MISSSCGLAVLVCPARRSLPAARAHSRGAALGASHGGVWGEGGRGGRQLGDGLGAETRSPFSTP